MHVPLTYCGKKAWPAEGESGRQANDEESDNTLNCSKTWRGKKSNKGEQEGKQAEMQGQLTETEIQKTAVHQVKTQLVSSETV